MILVTTQCFTKKKGQVEPTDVHRLEGPSSNPRILKMLEASSIKPIAD